MGERIPRGARPASAWGSYHRGLYCSFLHALPRKQTGLQTPQRTPKPTLFSPAWERIRSDNLCRESSPTVTEDPEEEGQCHKDACE